MVYLVIQVQKHKTGAVVTSMDKKGNFADAQKAFYTALQTASISISQMSCKVMIMDENMVKLKYDECINEHIQPDPEEESEE